MKQEMICQGPLTEDSLSESLSEFFRGIQPQRDRLFSYYRGEQTVPKGPAVRGRPNNFLRVPFPHYITEVHTSYFLGIPPTLAFERLEDGCAFEDLNKSIGLNHLLFDVGRDMSICGAGFVLVWLERAGIRACRCDPLSCFAVRSVTAGAPLLATGRLSCRRNGMAEGFLYEPGTVRPFAWDGRRVRLGLPERYPIQTVALVPFLNNCQGCGDFEMVTGLVDAYNLLLSGAMDDMQSVANAFLALYGMQGTTQGDIDEANRTRILSLTEGGRAEFVVKNLNHEALAQLEANLRRSILQMSMTPELSDEEFSGNASGVALQYKLWGIEQARAAKEKSFTDSMKQLLDVFSEGLAVLGRPVNLTDGQMTFYKNLPRNYTELAQTLLSLSPLLSQRTILENLPWVSDVEDELRRKAEETLEAMENS